MKQKIGTKNTNTTNKTENKITAMNTSLSTATLWINGLYSTVKSLTGEPVKCVLSIPLFSIRNLSYLSRLGTLSG